jgi:gas vesicle protein
MDLRDVIKGVAPLVGTALGGPLGGAAAAFLADKLGVKEKTIEAVTAVLNNGKLTPEQIVQVKDAEIEFEKFCKTNNLDVMKIHLENTKDARQMQATTRSRYPAILSTFITFGFFGVLGWMLYDDKIANSEPILIMLGALGAAFAAVVNFWLGSSHGSEQKNAAFLRR